MAQALLRKLADVQTAEGLTRLTALLKQQRIESKVHFHIEERSGNCRFCWRVFVWHADLREARVLLEGFQEVHTDEK